MKKISIEDLKIIKKLIQDLRRIKETGTAPINLTQFQKLGLVKKRVFRTPKGFIKDVKLSLTDLGKKILNVRL